MVTQCVKAASTLPPQRRFSAAVLDNQSCTSHGWRFLPSFPGRSNRQGPMHRRPTLSSRTGSMRRRFRYKSQRSWRIPAKVKSSKRRCFSARAAPPRCRHPGHGQFANENEHTQMQQVQTQTHLSLTSSHMAALLPPPTGRSNGVAELVLQANSDLSAPTQRAPDPLPAWPAGPAPALALTNAGGRSVGGARHRQHVNRAAVAPGSGVARRRSRHWT